MVNSLSGNKNLFSKILSTHAIILTGTFLSTPYSNAVHYLYQLDINDNSTVGACNMKCKLNPCPFKVHNPQLN